MVLAKLNRKMWNTKYNVISGQIIELNIYNERILNVMKDAGTAYCNKQIPIKINFSVKNDKS